MFTAGCRRVGLSGSDTHLHQSRRVDDVHRPQHQSQREALEGRQDGQALGRHGVLNAQGASDGFRGDGEQRTLRRAAPIIRGAVLSRAASASSPANPP